MKVTISFQNLKHTPSLDERIEEKTSRLQKYLDESFHAKWTCYVKDNSHYAEVNVVGKGTEFHASGKADNMYKTLDVVIGKIEKQIHKKQDKVKNKMHRKHNEPVILDYEQAWAEHDEDAA